jgi:hypothetical protein
VDLFRPSLEAAEHEKYKSTSISVKSLARPTLKVKKVAELEAMPTE